MGNFCSLKPGMTLAQVEAIMGKYKFPAEITEPRPYKLVDGDHLTVIIGYNADGVINQANTTTDPPEPTYKVLCGG